MATPSTPSPPTKGMLIADARDCVEGMLAPMVTPSTPSPPTKGMLIADARDCIEGMLAPMITPPFPPPPILPTSEYSRTLIANARAYIEGTLTEFTEDELEARIEGGDIFIDPKVREKEGVDRHIDPKVRR
eukprot:122508-Chlamydomonas_euryale.AAC.4